MTEHHSSTTLSVLPSRHLTLVGESQSREAEAVFDLTLGHGGVLHGGEHLPTVVLGRAGHEALGTPAVEGVVSPGLTGDVGEAADGGVGRDTR